MEEYLISEKASILMALRQIDMLSVKKSAQLFVVDTENKVIGSLSDGDCRRALINGKTIESSVTNAMYKDFTFIESGKYDLSIVSKIKELGLKFVPELDIEKHLIKVHDFTNGKSFIPIDAVIMAGGKGERLRPLTLETPKPLLHVADKPIIDYNIENLQKNGIDHINVTVNYLGEQIEQHFAEPVNGTQVKCVREPKFLGTMGSVRFVKEWYNDTILLMNSDLFTNIDLESFYLHFKKHNADMSVAAVPYNVDIPYGIFNLEDDRNITGITEKPSYHYYANAGIYLFKRELIETIPEDAFYNATDFILDLVKAKKTVIRFPITGYWIDIGKPDDFKKVQEFARNLNRR